jgi:hypothetical protein
MEEMIKVVEEYIFKMKGIKVKINIPQDGYNLSLLHSAYITALQYNKEKNG